MAGKQTSLVVQIVSDAKGASKGFAEAEGAVGGFQKKLEGASQTAGRVVVGIGAIAYAGFQAASDLQQSAGAIESVFGAQAAAVEELAARAAQANGLSKNSYQELASVIGSQLSNMGIAHDQLVPKTDQLIDLGADLAATYGGTTADAVAALSSLLRGETDPIERYGVSIKQADINARLAAQGLDDLEGPAAKAAQAQAVLGLLADQTGSAMGTFARESDTAAGSMQIARAEAENAAATLGEILLPLVSEGAQQLSGFAQVLADNKDIVIPLVAVLGTLAAVIWLVNFAMAANPFTLIALAIGAVIAIVIVMYQRFEWFRDLVGAVGRFFASAFDKAKDVISWIVEKVKWLFDHSPAGLISNAIFGSAPDSGDGGGVVGGRPRGGPGGGAPMIRAASPGGGGGFGGGGFGSGGQGGGGDTYVFQGLLTMDDAADIMAGGLDRRTRRTGGRPSVVIK